MRDELNEISRLLCLVRQGLWYWAHTGGWSMNHYLAAALLGWTLGRNDVVRPVTTPHRSSPMSQLARYTEQLRLSLDHEYPSWSPEADLRRSVVHALVGTSLDYREIGRRTLGHTWDQLSDSDRNDFVADLGTIIEHRFLKGEMGIAPDLRVTFQRETLADDGTASVYGTVVGQANDKALHIALEYRLLWRDRRWVVYDLVTDGDSLVESYRAQFDRIIARESFAGLKRRMKWAEARAEE